MFIIYLLYYLSWYLNLTFLCYFLFASFFDGMINKFLCEILINSRKYILEVLSRRNIICIVFREVVRGPLYPLIIEYILSAVNSSYWETKISLYFEDLSSLILNKLTFFSAENIFKINNGTLVNIWYIVLAYSN